MSSSSQQLTTETGNVIAGGEVVSAERDSAPGVWALAGQASLDMALPISAGALLAVAFMPPPLGIVAWVALIQFAAAMARAKGTFELYVGAYLGGLLFDLHALDFLRTRLNGSGLVGSHTADWLINGCLWALLWPLTLYVGRRVLRHTRWPMAVVMPLIWISSEYVRYELGWIVSWSPFPWLQLGITQAPFLHPIQIADLGGVWAVAAMVAAVNGALFEALAMRRGKSLLVALALFGGTWFYGEWRLRETNATPGPTVALVSHSNRANPAPPLADKPDVLLWSETAYFGVDESDPASIKSLEALARSTGSALVVGCSRRDDDAQFNSAVVVDPAAGYLGCYDKCFLVPWSEFTPWEWTGLGMKSARMSAGDKQPVFKLGQFTCGPSICYDICFATLFRRYMPRPDFFVGSSRETSDPTGYLPRMLLNMTRLRAVENRRSIVRNVEGGFSGLVTSTGEYTSAPEPPWKSPVTVGTVPIDNRQTLSAVAGDWLPLACCLGVTVLLFRSRRRNQNDIRSDSAPLRV